MQEQTTENTPETISADDLTTKINDSGRRSKLYIKLNKKFSEAFTQFCDVAKPGNMSDDEFASMIFMVGMDTINQQILNAEEELGEEIKVDDDETGPKVI